MKLRISDYIAIISSAGVIFWIISDFFGGMIQFLFTGYVLLIVPAVLLYSFSLVHTAISTIRKGLGRNRVKLVAHLFVFAAVVTFTLYLYTDILRSKRILTASMYDDFSSYHLVFRADNTCEHVLLSAFGATQRFRGKYVRKDDTILFIEIPYSDDKFIPRRMLIDRQQKALFLEEEPGKFPARKGILNYFKIE